MLHHRIIRSTLGLLATMALTTSVVACVGADTTSPAADETEEVGQTSDELYAAGHKIWRTLNIPVCWDNPSANNATERGWVQSAVEDTWSSVSYVTFTGWGTCTASSSGIHITISDEGPHTTALGRNLDGVVGGMVLNFTYKNWSTACQSSLQFCDQAIAVHEFGHALGFAHEQNRPDTPASCTDAPQGEDGDTLVGPWDLDSVMNYCNPDWNNGGALSSGDIRGVRQYYGSSAFAGNPQDGVNWGNGKVYFFNGSQYTRYDLATDKTDSGYPLSIVGHWGNWPSTWTTIDAALNWGNGKVYFFRGSEYLRYDIATDKVDAGYPLSIAGHWGNWPSTWTSVGAAIRWNNGKVYFFRGTDYIRYDIATDRVDNGYPAPISGNWPGVWSSGIEYVITTDAANKAYFFRGKQYLRYDMAADQTDSGYPLDIVGRWPGDPF